MGAVLAFNSRRRLSTMDGREMFLLFPQGWGAGNGPAGHWLYAVGFRDGTVKVGRSSKPRSRMLAYWRDADGLDWAHLFARFDDARSAARAERAALSICDSVATRIRRTETFRGLDRQTALRCVRLAITMKGRA